MTSLKRRKNVRPVSLANSIVLLLLACDTLLPDKASAVTCFSCTVKPPSTSKARAKAKAKTTNGTKVGGGGGDDAGPGLCSQFDASPRFQVDCPLSTFCQTRTFTLHTHKGSHPVTTRGCAQQDYSYQTYQADAGGWRTVTEIEETVYDEGCFIAVGQSLRRHRTQYCHCSKDLCNVAPRRDVADLALFSLLLLLANLAWLA